MIWTFLNDLKVFLRCKHSNPVLSISMLLEWATTALHFRWPTRTFYPGPAHDIFSTSVIYEISQFKYIIFHLRVFFMRILFLVFWLHFFAFFSKISNCISDWIFQKLACGQQCDTMSLYAFTRLAKLVNKIMDRNQ